MRGQKRSPLSVASTVAVYVLVFWVLLPGFLLSLGFRMDALVPVRIEAADGLQASGLTLLGLGLAFTLLSMGQLWVRGKGLPISHLPPGRFVSTGIYKRLRHPIYLGYTAAFAGLAVLLRSFWSLAFSTPLLIFGWVGYALFYEEPVLCARYGEDYAEYKKRTPLLIPRTISRPIAAAFHPALPALLPRLNRLADWTVFFRRGNLILVSYGIFVTLGSFIFMLHTSGLFIVQGVEKKYVSVFLVGASLLGAFFARAFWWLGHWREVVRQPRWGARQVGFVSFGALFGLVFACLIFGIVFHYSPLMVLDIVVRGMFIGYAFGRIGCLTYGCCWGKRSTTHGIVYHNPEAKVVRLNGGPQSLRHPAPLYSAVEGLVLFISVNLLANFPLPAGFLTALVFLLYPVGRGFIEFTRERRYSILECLNEGHLSCAVMFLVGVAMLFLLSPGAGPFSPRPWSLEAAVRSLPLLPVLLAVSGLVFFIASYHWKRIGSW